MRLSIIALLVAGLTSLAIADPLAAPANLEATASSPTEIRLSWSSVSGASSYIVLRDTDSSGYSYREISSAYGASYTDSDVKPGTTYYYVVKAKGESDSVASNQAHATTPAAPPTNVAAQFESQHVRLSWDSISNASSYVVLRSTDSGGYSYREVATSYGTSYDDNDVKSGTTYFYVVRTKTSSGASSANSNEARASVPMSSPKNVSASASSSSEIRLAWDTVSGASSYVILRDTDSSGYSYREVGTSYGGYYTDSGLTPGTKYYYVVKAKSSDSTSEASAQVSATTEK